MLKSLATHNTLRAAMAAIFAIVQSIDTTTHPQGAHFGTGHGAPLVLDDAQEELLSFARDAGQESGLFCQWVESLVCPVVVLPNGRLMTPAQHEALGAEGMTHNTSPGVFVCLFVCVCVEDVLSVSIVIANGGSTVCLRCGIDSHARPCSTV